MSKRRKNFASVIALCGLYCLVISCSGLPKESPTLGSVGSGGSGGSSGSGSAESPSSISGTVGPAASAGGVTIVLSGTSQATTTTDSSGSYEFSGLVSGDYTLTPSKAGLAFIPSSRTMTVDGTHLQGANFAANASLKASGPIVINGENGTVIRDLKITSATGDCVTVTNSTNVTIEESEIGPCGGNGIKIYGGSGIKVFDSYIHPETLSPGCCDHNDGIFATAAPRDLTIQGNVIGYGESNIEVQGATSVSVVGNFLFNPRGPNPRGQQFQCWSNCSGVTVDNNYVVSSTNTTLYKYADATIDAISFGESDSFVVRNNFISGGHSQSGCGIMADTDSNQGQILQNHLYNTGQCGIGLTDGSQTASGNYVYNRTPVAGGGNTAMYAAHYGQSSTCGPMTVTNNIADEIQLSGFHSGWWYPGGCGPISTSTDVFGQEADSKLSASSTFVLPLIPPQPNSCVALSPFSTQTSVAACNP